MYCLTWVLVPECKTVGQVFLDFSRQDSAGVFADREQVLCEADQQCGEHVSCAQSAIVIEGGIVILRQLCNQS